MPDPSEPDPTGILAAMRGVLAGLARLAVAYGVPYREVDELAKACFVEAAALAHPTAGSVSAVSVATGISRREVTRLTQPQREGAPRKSHASEIFARWLTDPRFRDRQRAPRKRLPRTGPHPSFQSLAESVSRDVKPRAHLDELCRLGIARFDEVADVVELLRDTFVPSTDERQMFGFLGENVADHLDAAVDNVQTRPPPHLEQAVFADELSPDSIAAVRPLVEQEWSALLQRLAPVLQELIDADRAAGRPQDQRIRIGLYTYTTRS